MHAEAAFPDIVDDLSSRFPAEEVDGGGVRFRFPDGRKLLIFENAIHFRDADGNEDVTILRQDFHADYGEAYEEFARTLLEYEGVAID